jgi:hypothetical protein
MPSKLSIGSLTIAGDDNKAYPDNWIGMSDQVDGGSKWLCIGGITDAGARRITLQADRVHVSGRLGVGTTDPKSVVHVEGGEVHSGHGYSFAERGTPFSPDGAGQRWVLYSHDKLACLWSGGRDLLSVTSGGDLTVAGKLTVTGGSNLFKMAQTVLQVEQGSAFQFDLAPGTFTDVYGAVASILGYQVNGWSGGGWGDRNQISFGVQVDAVDTKRVVGSAARGQGGTWGTLTIGLTVFGRG